MKTTKRILSVLLALAMSLGLLGITANAEVDPEAYRAYSHYLPSFLREHRGISNTAMGGDGALAKFFLDLQNAETLEEITALNEALYRNVPPLSEKSVLDILNETMRLEEDDNAALEAAENDGYGCYDYFTWLTRWMYAALYNCPLLPGKSVQDFASAFSRALSNVLRNFYPFEHYWFLAETGSTAQIEQPFEQVIAEYYGAGAISTVRSCLSFPLGDGGFMVSSMAAFTSITQMAPGIPFNCSSLEAGDDLWVSGMAPVAGYSIGFQQQPSEPVTITFIVPENYTGDPRDLMVYRDGEVLPSSLRTMTFNMSGGGTATLYFLDVLVNAFGTFCVAEPGPFYDQVELEAGTVSVIYPYETFGGAQPALHVIPTSTSNTGVHEGYLPVSGYSWNITFGNGQQPAGEVTVRVPFPQGADVNDLRVYHVDDEGNYAPMTILNLDKAAAAGYLEFKTNHFSVYAVFQRHEHQYTGVTTPPTCTAQGYTTFTCAEDGSSYTVDYVPALGHQWGEWVVTTPATTESEGVETRVCVRDASHTETRAIAKLQPDVQKWWQKLPAWVQWILQYLCFGWIWMK